MSENSKKIIIYSPLNAEFGWIQPVMEKFSLEVLLVDNSKDIPEKVKINFPSFVLMDVTMPEMNGIECCEAIKIISATTKVILISHISSLSLQDSAKESGVNLFVADSVAEIKVSEFIEASLHKKTLPEEVVDEIEREVLSKRVSQRFPFEGEVQYKMDENVFSGVFVNVSQEGLLFQTQNQVQLGTNLVLSWMDQGLKHIEISAIVVRQFASAHPQYPFLVGVQFLESSKILDDKIMGLSEESAQFNEGSEIELDLDLIQNLLSEFRKYFRDMFNGEKAPLFVELSISDVVEHERNSFQKDDPYSFCLQEVVSLRIISKLIENCIQQASSLKVVNKKYFTRIVILLSDLLEKIEFSETDSEELIKKTIQDNLVTERRQLNESCNQLYLAKASMLDVASKKIKRDHVDDAYRGGVDLIVIKNTEVISYQEHLEEMAKKEAQETKKKRASTTVKPPKALEKSVIKNLVQVQKTVSEEDDIAPKQNFIIPLGALLMVLFVLISWFKGAIQNGDDIKLLIKPNKIEQKSDDSLVLGISKSDWNQLDKDSKDLLFDQIEVYLTRKKMHQCKIMDGDLLIAAVYGTSFKDKLAYLHTVFLNPEIQK